MLHRKWLTTYVDMAIHVLAICDFVVAGWPGSEHDTWILNHALANFPSFSVPPKRYTWFLPKSSIFLLSFPLIFSFIGNIISSTLVIQTKLDTVMLIIRRPTEAKYRTLLPPAAPSQAPSPPPAPRRHPSRHRRPSPRRLPLRQRRPRPMGVPQVNPPSLPTLLPSCLATRSMGRSKLRCWAESPSSDSDDSMAALFPLLVPLRPSSQPRRPHPELADLLSPGRLADARWGSRGELHAHPTTSFPPGASNGPVRLRPARAEGVSSSSEVRMVLQLNFF